MFYKGLAAFVDLRAFPPFSLPGAPSEARARVPPPKVRAWAGGPPLPDPALPAAVTRSRTQFHLARGVS